MRLAGWACATTIATLLAGVSLAVVTTSEPEWWRLHFSQLGTHQDMSGTVFNAALMLSGVLFAGFVTAVHAATGTRYRGLFTAAGAATGLSLALAGAVPLDVSRLWHDAAARGVAAGFFGMLAAASWLWPGIRRPSRTVATVMVVAGCGYTAGITSLTVFEVVAFTLIGVWMCALTHRLHAGLLTKRAPEPPRPIGLVVST